MASIYAELHVAGHVIPILRFHYAATQATGARGRPVAKVRRGLVDLTADVPDHTLLEHWATNPHQRLSAELLLLDAGVALETLIFPGAYCVRYDEDFDDGTGGGGDGAYVCHFTLSDPSGWTLTPGGPTPYAAPAPREHGVPPVASNSLPEGPPQLVPGSPDHKLARWQEYQAAGKKWAYTRWSKQYDVNMRNAVAGIGREKEYQAVFGGESRILKTAFTNRQIDLLRPAEMYAGQLKTGKVSLGKQAKIDLAKDKWLIGEGYQVDYILEKGATKPFLRALDLIGATYQLGSQF